MRLSRWIGALCLVAVAGCSGPSGVHEEPERGPRTLPSGRTDLLGESDDTISSSSAALIADRTLEARILVVSADGKETTLPAIRQALDYMGTPYRVHVVTSAPGALTASFLASGTQGNYQGVILATSSLGYTRNGTWTLALSTAEWQALWDYEAAYGVRQVTWYTFPTADLGFAAATSRDTATSPIATNLTTEGRAVFHYLAGPIEIRNTFAYLAKPLAGTVPLLVDGAGNALAAVRTYPDGRENLSMTFDGNEFTTHSIATAYGAIDWVTRGLFLGYRRVFASPQIDDLFLESDIFTGGIYRMTGADIRASETWQSNRRGSYGSPTFTLSWAFNGEGSEPGMYSNDTLTPAARELQARFHWINHTYTHQNLNAVSYTLAAQEIGQNHTVAATLGLQGYRATNLVTPEISGLTASNAMRAAFDQGVRFLVTDTSVSEPAVPNTGTWNTLQPGIHMIPRRPTNLFYNVSTPTEWVTEYNSIYRAEWGRNLTFDEIVDFEANLLLNYMLKGEQYPWMFHQANVRNYTTGRSLLSDLLDRAFTRYRALYTLPIQSPPMERLGELSAQRATYNGAGVRGIIAPGRSITLSVTKNAVVPVTGLALAGADVYGGKPTSFVTLTAGQSQTIALVADPGAGNAAPLLVVPIADRAATVFSAVDYTVASSFSDPNADVLSFTATLSSGAALPVWLSFDGGTGRFTGTPPTGANGSYSIVVVARDPSGASASDTFVLDVAVPAPTTQTVTFVSLASEDGWVLESTESGNVGGTTSSTGTGDRALRIGDDASDRQYKAIVSFDTSSLPDGAVVLEARLQLTRGGTDGTSPLTTHAPCQVELKRGNFGTSAGLQLSDFQAPADLVAGQLLVAGGSGTVHEVAFGSSALVSVNQLGRTQLRIACVRDDNDDRGTDVAGFYAAESGTSSRRPRLIVTYR